MNAPLDGPIQPQPEQPPLRPAQFDLLNLCARMRESINRSRALPARTDGATIDFARHERRLDEIERLIRLGRREDADQVIELRDKFLLDFQADMAAITAGVYESLVRFTDVVAQRVEEKKLELASEQLDDIEETLMPYKHGMREQMLGVLPIEKRRPEKGDAAE